MFRIEEVNFSYGRGRVALVDITLEVKAGERIVLLGGNGCGKTTLLKIMDGLIFPQKGRIFWHGYQITKRSLKKIEKEFRRKVAFLFQDVEAMLFNPTVWDEIAFGPRQLELTDIEERVEKWGRKLGVHEVFKRHPGELSIGEKKKVALASLLVLEPEVLLLDEPLSNLDPRSTGEVIDLLWELGITTVVTTQNLSLAPELGDRAVLISEEHRIIYEGKFDPLLEDEKLLLEANLLHMHRHRHDGKIHRHFHPHDWK